MEMSPKEINFANAFGLRSPFLTFSAPTPSLTAYSYCMYTDTHTHSLSLSLPPGLWVRDCGKQKVIHDWRDMLGGGEGITGVPGEINADFTSW